MKPHDPAMPCPCGGPRYTSCCGRCLDGDLPAPDALTLMRSRYTAFVLDRRDYLLATWHRDTRPATIEAPEPELRWLGLSIRAHSAGGDSATVEFVARSKLGGRARRLHERSRFVREAGRWYYLDGEFPEGDG
ncbi:MAG: YchJ family metal-binding protein [Pseudomonadota bacterium]